jgi:hypothetical protein
MARLAPIAQRNGFEILGPQARLPATDSQSPRLRAPAHTHRAARSHK